jgi:type II secretion system protein G
VYQKDPSYHKSLAFRRQKAYACGVKKVSTRMKNIWKRQEGFTLLELLIVIVIIGILAVLIVPNLTAGPQRARDSQRKSDLRNVKTALETYFNDNNGYPSSDYVGLGAYLVSNYIKAMPTDPSGGTPTTPKYTYAPTACAGTSPVLCTKYELGATLENNSEPGGTNYKVSSVN